MTWRVLLCLFGLCTVSGQQFPFVQMTGPGAPANPYPLLLDRTGRLWAGSPEGLHAFDGKRFFHVQFPAGGVLALAEDSDGAIWVASMLGVHRYFQGRLDRIVEGVATGVAAIGPDAVLAIVVPPAGASEPAVFHLIRRDGANWAVKRLANLATVGQFSLDKLGNVLFAVPQGWSEVRVESLLSDPDSAHRVVVRHPYPAGEGTPYRVFRDRVGCIWLRSEGETMYRCPGDSKAALLPFGIASMTAGSQIRETSAGDVILPNTVGISIGRPGSFRVASAANGLPPGVVDAIEGADGTLWLATNRGIFRWTHPFQLEFWTSRDGSVEASTVLHAAGRIYAGGNGGLIVLDPDRGRWRRLSDAPELHFITHLLAGPGQSIYAALYYGSVAQVNKDGSILRRVRGDPEPRASGMRLARTPNGDLWVSGRGVQRVVSKPRHLELKTEDLPGLRFMGLDAEVDNTGRLWACYAGGLIVRTDTAWRHITKDHGLRQSECRSLAVHPNGDVWYGYNTFKGFARIRFRDDGSVDVRNYESGDSTGSGQVHFLDVDRAGRLWRGSLDGVYVAYPEDAEQGQWLRLNADDGLPHVTTNQQGFYQDPDGSVWIGAGDTLMRFVPPEDLARPSRAPQVFLSALSWDGGALAQAEAITQMPAAKQITAHFGSLDFDRRSNLRVRYRLLPSQTSWNYAKSLDVALDRIAPGSHTLEFAAQIGNGPWSGSLRKQLQVLTPAWRSAPFLLAYLGVVSATILAGLAWWRRRRRFLDQVLPDLAEWRLAAVLPEESALIGSVLDGRFEVGRLAARGGFATVFEGRDLETGLESAIKVFRQDLGDEGWRSTRFEQEVIALERLDHPNVVRIYGHGLTADGAPYLVMEFIQGVTLRELLDGERLTPARIARLLRQTASALTALHERNIYHRDLKPDNLMIRQHGTPAESLVLIDFSIAIVKDPERTLHGLSRVAGSLAYMAPEQTIGYSSASTDVYSLAKIVIEMLAGEPLSVLLRDASLDLPQRAHTVLTGLRPELGEPATTVLCSALNFDPLQRPQNVEAFAAPLVAALEASSES